MHPKVNPYDGCPVSSVYMSKTPDARGHFPAYVKIRILDESDNTYTDVNKPYARYLVECALGKRLEYWEKVRHNRANSYQLEDLVIHDINSEEELCVRINAATLVALYDYLRAVYYPAPSKDAIVVCKHERYLLDARIIQQMWSVFADRVTNPIAAEPIIDPLIEFVESTPALIEPPVPIVVDKENNQMAEQPIEHESESELMDAMYQKAKPPEPLKPPPDIRELMKKLAPPQDANITQEYPSVDELAILAHKVIKRPTIAQRISKLTNVFMMLKTVLCILMRKFKLTPKVVRPQLCIPGSPPMIVPAMDDLKLYLPDGTRARPNPLAPLVVERIVTKTKHVTRTKTMIREILIEVDASGKEEERVSNLYDEKEYFDHICAEHRRVREERRERRAERMRKNAR